MPRTARAIEPGLVYHVLNRGNGRMRLFHKDPDFEAFEQVLAEGSEKGSEAIDRPIIPCDTLANRAKTRIISDVPWYVVFI